MVQAIKAIWGNDCPLHERRRFRAESGPGVADASAIGSRLPVALRETTTGPASPVFRRSMHC